MTDLLKQFEAFVQTAGGKIIDDSGRERGRFICASLPIESAVQPGDVIYGGMAVRVEDDSLQLCTYLLRQVCTNGLVAPMPQQAETFTTGQAFEFDAFLTSSLEMLRNVEFPRHMEQIQFSLFDRVNEHRVRQIAYQIVGLTGNRGITRRFIQLVREEWQRPRANPRLTAGRHPRRFDVINGVTALAKETTNPAVRWELMRLGGDLLTGTYQDQTPEPESKRREVDIPQLG